jgi:hypothetical protein
MPPDGAVRFLRAETFCERGARGEQKFWLRGVRNRPATESWHKGPHLRNWGSFHDEPEP